MTEQAWQVGQRVEPFVVESVDAGRVKTMAAILQDPTPIHLDPEATRARGLGDALATQGALNMTWFTETAARFAGGWERLLDFNVRFLDNVYAGERVECTGTVTAVDASKGEAELELLAAANGRPVLAGTAVVRAG
jgi:3-hydroxybutyryl-CoA dehydratase